MRETIRRRGRPKGTGIDDSITLRTITSLLAANIELKPTTAIRRSGVTDPSVVRRLREKLKLIPDTLAPPQSTPVLPPKSPAAKLELKSILQPQQPPPRPLQTDPPRIQDTAARFSKASAASAPPPQQSVPDTPQPAATADADPSTTQQDKKQKPDPPLPDPQLEALRLSAEAAAAMSRLYLHCINHAAQTSPLSLALSSQTIMSQWFAQLMSAQIAARQKPNP